jgi:hypothetical protein
LTVRLKPQKPRVPRIWNEDFPICQRECVLRPEELERTRTESRNRGCTLRREVADNYGGFTTIDYNNASIAQFADGVD